MSASALRGIRSAIVLPCERPLLIVPPRPYLASRQRVGRGSGPTVKRAIAPGRTGTSGPSRVKYATATPLRFTAPRRTGGNRRGALPLLPALSWTVTEKAYAPSGAGFPFTSPSQVAVRRPRRPEKPATCLALPPSVRHTPNSGGGFEGPTKRMRARSRRVPLPGTSVGGVTATILGRGGRVSTCSTRGAVTDRPSARNPTRIR